MQVLSKIAGVRLAVMSLAILGVLIVVGCGGTSSTSSNVTATPAFSPGGGTYNASQSVTISDATSGAVLYCTTDGTTPTTSSQQCAQPTTVFKTEFLQAIAVAPGKAASAVASAGYTINLNAAATPTFSPAGGTYTFAQTVTINDATSGANIYYCITAGCTPTASSTLYTGPITVSQSETLSAIAAATGYNNSGVASAAYTIVPPAAAPTFSPAGGSYTSAQAVTIADTTSGAAIYYTTDGTPATATSTRYSTPVAVTQSETINAIAVAPGYSSTTASAIYSINLQQAPAPTFSLANNQLTISDATVGANIYYTTDGTQPSASSPLHGAAPVTITVTPGETVNAIAVATGYTASTVVTYTVSLSAASQPTFSLGSNNQLTISETVTGATIYYTTDGTPPSVSSPLHGAAPLTITVTAGQTVNAIAVASGYTNSTVATYAVTAAPTPSFTLANNQLTIGDTAAGATIYYTVDGTQPSTSSSLHGAATVTITVTAGEVINAIAVAANYVSSAIGGYTAKAAQPPSFSLTGSQLTISNTTTWATIYYTTDGNQPTTSSPLSGSSPITITVTAGEVINAIAAAPNYLNSVVENYTIGVTGTPEFSLSGGNLTIDDATTEAVIYYTINGSAPTTSSPLHGNAPVTVAVSIGDIVQAIALAPGNTISALASYTVKASAATPQITPNGGYFVSSQVPVSVSITEASSGATVYYTLNGTTPSASNGTRYSVPFPVSLTASSPTVTVKAIAVGSSYNDSAEADSAITLLVSPTISGQVVSGSARISGATVQLYAAGSTGYGKGTGGPTLLSNTTPSTVTTDASGTFAFSYSCPAAGAPGDLLYLVASGGNAGQGTNSGIKLMTALGSCGAIASNTFLTTNGNTVVTVNEATTIASAYALSAFAATDANGGIDVGAPALTGGTCDAADGWRSFGKETCNYNGLANAFKAVNNLVNIGTGTALTHTPAYPTDLAHDPNVVNNSTVPTARINALADMLASCVESDVSGCASGLFPAAKLTAGPAPTDTLQAALNIAQNPGSNGISVSTLLGLIPATPPYSTGTLVLSGTNAPTDLTLALTFTGAGLGIAPGMTLSDNNTEVANSALGIDAAGNIWVGGYIGGPGQASGEMVAEFNALGAPVTLPTQLSTDNPPVPTYGGFNPEPLHRSQAKISVLAIDQAGNLWTDDGGTGNTLKISTSPSLSLSLTARGSNGTTSVAIDGNGNAWYGTSTYELFEILANGQAGVDNRSLPVPQVNYLTFDSGNIEWAAGITSSYNPDIYQLSTSDGSVAYDLFPSSADYTGTTLAADSEGNVYGCDPTGANLDVFNSSANSSSGGIVHTYPTATGRACGEQLVLDGQGHLFAVVNSPYPPSGTNIDEYTTGGALISPLSTGYTGTSSAETPTLNGNANLTGSTGTTAAIDGSGNLWVLNYDTSLYSSSLNANVPSNVLVEYVGIGAPVVTPASVALTNGQLGLRP